MNQNSETSNKLNAGYIIQELSELFKNNPEAAPRLIENLMNLDYDVRKKDEQFYKLLTEEQRKLLHDIYTKRKHDKVFDYQFQKFLLVAAGAGGLTWGIISLIEKNNKT